MADTIEVNGIRLRDPEDTDTLRDNILEGVKEELAASFPRSYGGVRLELQDLHYDGPEKWNYDEQGRALMEDKFLARKLRGTLRLVDEATGDVLEEGTHSLMRVPWMTPRGTFVHGGNEYTCFHPAVKVWTEDGEMPIGDLVKRRWSGRVWSYNFDTGEFELRRVVGWSEKKKTRPLGTVEFTPTTGFQPSCRGGRKGFSVLWATENHQLMRADGSEIAAVDTKSVLVVEERLTPSQRQMVLGTMLGDGHISPEGIYRASHCAAQEEYLELKWRMLAAIAPSGVRPARENSSHPQKCFHTVVLNELKQLREKIYPAGRRSLVSGWFRECNEQALAFWFGDDGSSQYQRDTNSPVVTLHTNNFQPEEVEELRRWMLERWGLESHTDGSRARRTDCDPAINRLIVLTGDSAWRFLELTAPFLPETLRYKFLASPAVGECSRCGARVDRVRDVCSSCLLEEVRQTPGKLSKTIRHRFGNSAKVRDLATTETVVPEETVLSRWERIEARYGREQETMLQDCKLEKRVREVACGWRGAGSRSYGKRELVYDITVEGNHNYVVQGVVVHNTVLQNRLMPGPYTRRAENGLLETHFNPRPGSGRMFRVAMDPETAQFRLGVKGSNLHFYSLLKDLGVPEDQLERQWGPEVYQRNKDKYDRRVLPRAYKQLVPTWRQEKDADHNTMATAVREALDATEVSRGVAARTLPNWFDQQKAAAWRAAAIGRKAGAVMMAKRANALDFAPDFTARELKNVRLHDHIKDRSEYNLARSAVGVVKFANFSIYPEDEGAINLLNALQAQAEEEWEAGGEEEDFYDVMLRHVSDSALGSRVKYASAPTEKEREIARRTTEAPKSYAQAEAGNYRKGILYWDGLRIRLETPKGAIREGFNENDEVEWSFRQMADYGYVKGSMGKDGDQVDVFIGPDLTSEVVYIIDQIDQKTGEFDEHKAVLGTNGKEEAKKLYLSNYEAGWKCGKITSMTLPQFKTWVTSGRKRKPVADLAAIKAAKDHAAFCAAQDPSHFDEASSALEALEKQAFSRPENPDVKEDHAKYQLCAGMNDWELAITWCWCDIEHTGDDRRRLWFKVKFPDRTTSQDDYDPKKVSKEEHEQQAAKGKEHGEKAWKTWKRVASNLVTAGNERYVSENEGRHRTVTSSIWEQAFRDAMKHEDMQPFVEDSGELRSDWRESKSASKSSSTQHADSFSPDLDADAMQEAYDAIYGKIKPRLASMQAWPDKWMPPGSDQLGWINWYRNYLEGVRTDDDDRQIKRWKSFKARHGSQFAANPTPRRAFALRYWAIDPLKLLPENQRETFQQEMDDYRAEQTARWLREKTADFALPDLQALGTFLNTNHQAGIPVDGTEDQIEQSVIRFLGGDDSEASALMAVADMASELDPSAPTEAVKAAAPSKGCLMLQVPDHDSLKIVKWVQENVPERDLAGEGIERYSHVTVLYGFDPDVTWKEVKPLLPEGTIDFKLGRIKRFEANPQRPDSDVLVVEVESEDLQELHKKLCEEFGDRVKKTYSDYKPHLTLAYLRPTLCRNLDGHGNFAGQQFACSRLKFSGPNKKRFITLKTS